MRVKKGHRASPLRSVAAGIVKDLLGRLVVLFRAHHRLLRERGIIVAFHSITTTRSDGALRCSLHDFESYCNFFVRYMKPCGLSDLVERVQRGHPLEGGLAITFDDGYADNAELAAPVLGRLGLSATFFVTTRFVGSNKQAAWDEAAGVRSRWMSSEQVIALDQEGHDIGAHTRNHCDLGAVTHAEAIAEIAGSAEDIKSWTGVRPSHFAVPYGRPFPWLEQMSEIARSELGFQTVTLCRGGLLNPMEQSAAWERIPISPDQYLSPYAWLFDVLRDRNRSFPKVG